MALTRKMLSAMDIPAEKIDEIITAHTETVNALKEERDSFREDAEKYKSVSEELATVKKELETMQKSDWESKYKEEHEAFEKFKTDIAGKEEVVAKETAYKELLSEIGVSEKRVGSILKVTDLSTIELDKDGKLKNADTLKKNAKSEWADFIVKTEEKGSSTPNPPNNNGGSTFEKMSLAEKMSYANEHPSDTEVRNWLK